MTKSTIDWKSIYQNLDIKGIIPELDPVDKGEYFTLLCPECGKKEAYLYKNNKSFFKCTRDNKCGETFFLWQYLKDQRGKHQALKDLSTYSGIEINCKSWDQIRAEQHKFIDSLENLSEEAKKELKKMKDQDSPITRRFLDLLTSENEERYENFKTEYEDKFKQGSIVTGFSKIDEAISIMTGDLNIIKGFSGHGKTSFMLNLVANLIMDNPQREKADLSKNSCLYITYETSALRVKSKFLNILAKKFSKGKDLLIELQNKKDSTGKKPFFNDIPEVIEAYNQAKENKELVILDSPEIDLNNLGELIEIAKFNTPKNSEHRNLIVFIDYFQLIPYHPKDPRSQGWEIVKEKIYQLEYLAKDKEIILFVGSQVNEEGQAREGRDIYHASTNVIDIYNRSHSKTKQKTDSGKIKGDTLKYTEAKDRKALINISIDKARYFPTDSFPGYLLFDGYLFEENPDQSGINKSIGNEAW